MSAADDDTPHRDFAGRRLLLSLLRVLHIVGLAGLSAALLAQAPGASRWGLLMLGTGVSIAALDRWSDRYYFHQVKGLTVLGKIALVAALSTWPGVQLPLFWFLLVFSVAMSHAPGRIRHRRVF